jgi:aspartyl-tRNA(Asn)/glutamyl-tRNA(Gln) amidotransferase subunit A
LARLCLARIDALDAKINAFIHVEPEAALAAARAADGALARGAPAGLLHGVSLARKDNIARAMQRFTSGSRAFAQRLGADTAAVLRRIDAAGAIDLGGTNLSEFAFHVHGCNSLCGPPRNPWDTTRVAGGSSGGAAAAAAARMVFGAIGTDSGGSIRSPSALCGIVGLAPTQGLVSRHGTAPSSASVDVVGPMARKVQDCARLLAVMAGGDPFDPATSKRPVPDYESRLDRSFRGLRLGILREYRDVSDATARVIEAAIGVFRGLGAEPVEIPPPDLDTLNARAAIVLVSEAGAAQGSTLRAHWNNVHPEVRDRLLLAYALPEEAYRAALAARAGDLRRFCAGVFAQAELVLMPSAPEGAPLHVDVMCGGAAAGQGIASSIDPGRYTRAANYLGLPALALPAGFDAAGLPLGIQLLGKPFSEALLLNAGHRYQRATDWHCRRPSNA